MYDLNLWTISENILNILIYFIYLHQTDMFELPEKLLPCIL